MHCCKQSVYETCAKYIPVLSWLPHYNFQDMKGDLIAGFTVGLTVVPQGLALAQLANLPPQYGLYSAFMGSFMYSIFGTCKDLVIGPTSVMALMTADYVQTGGPLYASLLCFFCGCFQLILGTFNLGFLVNFISAPVLSGFTSAAAIITATAQLKGIFGLKFKSRGFLNTVYNIFLHISRTNFCDMAMGMTTIFLLLLLRHYKDHKCGLCKLASTTQRTIRALWWSFATARNALVVVICSLLVSTLLSLDIDVFTLTQSVDAGLPSFRFPEFYVEYYDSSSNLTVVKTADIVLRDLGSGAIVIPFISLLEAIAIAKTFTRGSKLQATREMIALGMGNLMGSFVSSYPVTGSFSRSVINNASGVRTPLGGAISGTFVLLALCLIAPVFHFIPKSCLSAIIFSAVIFMIHLGDIPAMWKTNKLELIPFSTTFFCSFAFGLEYGLFLGTLVGLGMLLYKQNKPTVLVSVKKGKNDHRFLHITPDNSIYFPSADHFKGVISKALYSQPDCSKCTVIIHGDNLKEMDYTTAMGIKNMVRSVKKDKAEIIFQITRPSSIKALSCLEDFVYICKQDDELKAIIEKTENCCEQNESVECSSAEMLLAKSPSSENCVPNGEESLSKSNSTQITCNETA